MNASDGEAMNQARMVALEQILLECFLELCAPLPEEICKQRMERAIEARMDSFGTEDER